jgi:Predicted permease
MAFEMASTNLVLELSIILIVLMGWHFMVAEAIAAPIMVAILALLFRMFLRPQLVRAAKDQAEKGIAGRMEGHAEMDMSVPAAGPLWQRSMSDKGLAAISHYFVMDWVFFDRSSALGHAVGTAGGRTGRHHCLRLLCRGHPARRCAVERWHHLRRRPRLHPRRPDRAADNNRRLLEGPTNTLLAYPIAGRSLQDDGWQEELLGHLLRPLISEISGADDQDAPLALGPFLGQHEARNAAPSSACASPGTPSAPEAMSVP